jgi:hypothetical protein
MSVEFAVERRCDRCGERATECHGRNVVGAGAIEQVYLPIGAAPGGGIADDEVFGDPHSGAARRRYFGEGLP